MSTSLETRSTSGNEARQLIYNVTLKVDHSIVDPWIQWLLEEHIPAVMATGCFLDYRVVKILEIDESDGPTYAVQYKAANKEAYQEYVERFAAALRNQSFEKWGDRFIAFRTIMEIVK